MSKKSDMGHAEECGLVIVKGFVVVDVVKIRFSVRMLLKLTMCSQKEIEIPFPWNNFSFSQIYESAVRAQDRHQVQRAMRVSRVRDTEPPTNCAADHHSKTFQNRKTTSEHSPVGALPSAGDDDPWLSEYTRCFSTRSL